MLGGLKLSQIKQVVSISNKLQLDKSKLKALQSGQEEGRDQEELLAELLGVPDGMDAKTYLNQKLSPQEYAVLKQLVANFTKGNGVNPLE